MSDTEEPSIFHKFQDQIKDILQLGYVQSILHWDMQTYMPPEAINQRSSAISLVNMLNHQKFTSPEMGEHLISLQKIKTLNKEQKREIELFKREYDRRVKIPDNLVKKISKQASITQHKWQTAKKNPISP